MMVLILLASTSPGQELCCQEKPPKPIGGKADVLRSVPKKFATFLKYLKKEHAIKLQFEDEDKPETWPINADAEVKLHGWWGRLDQLKPKQRIYVWLDIDRKKKPISILMVADEISEKDIHGRVEDEQRLDQQRQKQKEFLRNRWRKEGLPATVLFLHKLGGEMLLMLDHEAMRWGRYLRPGDQVTIEVSPVIKATVKKVRPWRERTMVQLVTKSGLDQATLKLSQRVLVKVPEPPKAVQASALPTDMGRLKDREARIEWFLASTYCTCKNKGDRCTGMFYSLASCNINICGMPGRMRSIVGKMIDKGLSDKEIFESLLKQRGKDLLKPHLLR